jgi:hypothetical protein
MVPSRGVKRAARFAGGLLPGPRTRFLLATAAVAACTAVPVPSLARTRASHPVACLPPYAPSSSWNTPIGAAPKIDPQSALYIDYMLQNRDQNVLTSDPSQYSFPVFLVGPKTPRRRVAFNPDNPYGYHSGTFSDVTLGRSSREQLHLIQGSWSRTVPMPADVSAAKGDDAHVVIWDERTGDEWAFWQLSYADGSYVATNGYHYNTRWSGRPPRGFGSRGGGIPYLAGLIRPCEIAQGHIDHALAFGYRTPSKYWVAPATKSDGDEFGDAFPEIADTTKRLPEGARLQLDPRLSDDVLARLKDIHGEPCSTRAKSRWRLTPCLVIAHALQRYGMIVTDHSGRTKLYAEYSDCRASPCSGWTAHWGQTYAGRRVPALDEYTANPIPLGRFRVLALGRLSQ